MRLRHRTTKRAAEGASARAEFDQAFAACALSVILKLAAWQALATVFGINTTSESRPALWPRILSVRLGMLTLRFAREPRQLARLVVAATVACTGATRMANRYGFRIVTRIVFVAPG